jgi:hypothetical protein
MQTEIVCRAHLFTMKPTKQMPAKSMTQERATHCIFNVLRNHNYISPSSVEDYTRLFLQSPRDWRIDFLATNAELLISSYNIPLRVLEIAAG